MIPCVGAMAIIILPKKRRKLTYVFSIEKENAAPGMRIVRFMNPDYQSGWIRIVNSIEPSGREGLISYAMWQ